MTEIISSPQFRHQLALFSHALMAGELNLAQFGLQGQVGGWAGGRVAMRDWGGAVRFVCVRVRVVMRGCMGGRALRTGCMGASSVTHLGISNVPPLRRPAVSAAQRALPDLAPGALCLRCNSGLWDYGVSQGHPAASRC